VLVSLHITDVIKPRGFNRGEKIYFLFSKPANVFFVLKKLSTRLNLLQLVSIVVMSPEILLI
jgi:hypothetical protein